MIEAQSFWPPCITIMDKETTLRLIKVLMLTCVGISVLAIPSAFAGGECCTRGNLALAGAPESAWSLQLDYDFSSMKTIREGTKSVTPDEVLDGQMMHGAMKYSVPTKMIMQKYTLAAQYKPAAFWRVTATLPYLINDMDMRMAMKSDMGMPRKSDGPMDTVQGLGDATLGTLYTLVAPAKGAEGWDLALGLGLKLPTGKSNVKHAGSDTNVHAMMQLGSGSWDPILILQGGLTTGKLTLRLNGAYHLATRGDEGYQYGDMISVDAVARYRAASAVRIGLGLNFLNTGKDIDHDGNFSSPTSMIDNTENTGLTAFYLAPEIQIALPGTGGSFSLAFQQPIYQNVTGTQQVLDWRVLASVGWTY